MVDPNLERMCCEENFSEFFQTSWPTVDPAKFTSNWHMDAIADHLTAVADRQIKRLIINVPPRTAKSLEASVAFPAWVWAQDTGEPAYKGAAKPAIKPDTWRGPGVKFLTVSYAEKLSFGLANKSRRIIQSPWYQKHWGERVKLLGDQNAKHKFENTAGGYRFSTSTGGGVIGDGGDIIIVDDPHNTLEMEGQDQRAAAATWWDEVLSTRFNQPSVGAFIVIMQRLHASDLTGHILAREHGWDHLCIPMRYEPKHSTPIRSSIGFTDPRTEDGELLWPERLPDATVKELETKLNVYGTAGQFQQRPTPRDGGQFKRHWFKIARTAPKNGRSVRGWDLAASTKKMADLTAGVKMTVAEDGQIYVEHVFCEKIDGLAVPTAMKTLAEQDGYNVSISFPQDPGQAGLTQARSITSLLAGFMVSSSTETGDKLTRSTPFSNQCEAGNVHLVEGEWNKAFLDELEMFPFGAHDDRVDAASRAFNKLFEHPDLEVCGLDD